MIERVAIKYKGTVYAGSDKENHLGVYHRLYNTEKELDKVFDVMSFTLGFLTDDGEFLDSVSAADHAFECGQIQESKKKLYPEDLK